MARQNTPPLSATYINVQEARASNILPAVGTWDATPTEMICAYFEDMTLNFTYERGGAGGAFDWQVEVSPYSVAANVPASASEWLTEAIYAAGGIAAGADTQSRVQREFQTYQATAAGAEDFTYGPVGLDGTIERVRVRCRESGNVGAPGTLHVQAVFS
jgi:hypothetical protein